MGSYYRRSYYEESHISNNDHLSQHANGELKTMVDDMKMANAGAEKERTAYLEVKSMMDTLTAAKNTAEKERDEFQQQHIHMHKIISRLEIDLQDSTCKRDEYKRSFVESEHKVRELEDLNRRFVHQDKELREEVLRVHNEVSGLQQQNHLLTKRLGKAEADREDYENKVGYFCFYV